jgi:hypothetical protein
MPAYASWYKTFVTLSAAKSLVSLGNKTEILRCAQNDRSSVTLYALRMTDLR